MVTLGGFALEGPVKEESVWRDFSERRFTFGVLGWEDVLGVDDIMEENMKKRVRELREA